MTEKLDIVMSILDPNWKYTHSTATDIRKTFAKARQKLAQSKASHRANTPERGATRAVRAAHLSLTITTPQ